MLADIRAYDRCETGKRRGEQPRYQYGQDQSRRPRLHRCEAPSELRAAIEHRSYYQKPIEVARRLYAAKDNADGWPGHGHVPLCRGCFRRALRKGFTPDQWAELNAKAARQPLGKHARFPKPFKPTRNHPRIEKPEQTFLRIKAAIDKEVTAVARDVIGRSCGEGMILTTTNDHIALIQPGESVEQTISLSGLSTEWIDLPAEFQLVCRRVALLANERMRGVTLTVGPKDGEIRLTVSGQSYEYGEASEWLPLTAETVSSRAEPFRVCLSANYLDLVCGAWPLRWYLRRSRTREREHLKNPSALTETEYQTFQPAGCDWRLVIMPMRI